MVPPPEDPGLRHGSEAGSSADGGRRGAAHQHKPAMIITSYYLICLSCIATILSPYYVLNKATSPLLIVVPVPRLQNLGEEIHNAEVKMFVNGLSEVDVILSKVNVLMSEVNVKLSRCPPESRKVVLSRLSNILFELKWSVSLSQESSSDGDDEESSDEESLSWDSGEDYNAQLATMSSQARWRYQARSHLEHIFW